MKAFISRAGFADYAPTAEANQLVYDGCNDFYEALSTEVRDQLPAGFYFDLLKTTFDYASDRLRAPSELADDQIEDYVIGQAVVASLSHEEQIQSIGRAREVVR